MFTDPVTSVPPGSQDLLAPAVRRRRHVQRTWFTLAEAHGYDEVIPPTFEYEEVFTRGGAAELARRLIRFVDRDGRILALRADFTSSLARVAATRLQQHALPVRLSYAGRVYRQEADGGGRPRELFQLGAELIGEPGPSGDLEVLRLLIATLRALGIERFQINLGDIRFVLPLLAGLSAADAESVRVAIDRRDRGALRAAVGSLGLSDAIGTALDALPDLIGRAEILERARTLAIEPGAAAAIESLARIGRGLTEAERRHVVYDLGEVRGLGYYTGIQFEVFVAGFGRAVGYGGRYDELLALYGADRPAVGFALEMDALAEMCSGGS